MFEKRKLDNLRIQVFEEIGRRCEAEYDYLRYPPIYGLGGDQAAASIVAVGETLLDTLIDAAPVQKDRQKAARKEIIRAIDLESAIAASIFFAHALVHWILVRDECLHLLGRGEPQTPHDVQSLAMLRQHFPLPAASESVLTKEAPIGFPTLRLTPETFSDDPPLESGYTMYLREPEYADQSFAGEPVEGEEPRDRLEELRDTHIMVSAQHFQVTASREGMRLAMGAAFDGSVVAENNLREDKSLEATLGLVSLKTWWDAAEEKYYGQLADMQEALLAHQAEQQGASIEPPV
jgi:hypothetical protein